MKFAHLVGRCLFCHGDKGPYDPNARRFCCTQGLAQEIGAKFGKDLEIFPTVYPFPSHDNGVFAPPHPSTRPASDLFAVDLRDRRDSTQPVGAATSALPALPYPIDVEETLHLRCGNATIYGLGNLATAFDFVRDSITVLDMATYNWSNTLKDPRSWAVINTALRSGVKHLGVWTAGNAGLSLARLAYNVNRSQAPNNRIAVYCYSENGSLPKPVKLLLQRFQACVVDVQTMSDGKIFPPDKALERLNASVRPVQPIKLREYWDVTDGWDGVGLYAYRLISRQICQHLRPDYIVLPLGTGDLFFGFYLGRQDCLQRSIIKSTECRLVAAAPVGENLLRNYDYYGLEVLRERPSKLRVPPIAPKLETIYTPLLLVMYRALLDEAVRVIEVSLKEQEAASSIVCGRRDGHFVAAEPSALIAFAALQRLASKHIHEHEGRASMRVAQANARVVVVNSGCGAVGPKEDAFLQSHLRSSGGIG